MIFIDAFAGKFQDTQGTSVAVLCKAEGTNINTSSSTVWYYVKIKSGANKGKIGYVHSSLVDGFKESELDRPNSRAEALGSDGTLIKSGAKGSEVRKYPIRSVPGRLFEEQEGY